MAAEYSAFGDQTVAAGAGIVFTEAPVPCNRGLIYHRDDSPLFRLASPSAMNFGAYRSCCCCGNLPTANYVVTASANVSIPTDGTVGPVSLGVYVDGELDPASVRTVTPAAAGDVFSIRTQSVVVVPWLCRCSSVSIRNVGDQSITVTDPDIIFRFAGVRR